jgi:hypothetical protein
MASQEWIEIYRSYTSDELDTAISDLKQQETLFTQQSVGSKSFSKDLRELRDKLHAAERVRNERSQSAANQGFGIPDFSNVRF